MHRWNGVSDFPVVITIFSAPNYCDIYNNKGAVIKFDVNYYFYFTNLFIEIKFFKISFYIYANNV